MEGCLEERTEQNLGGHGLVSGPGYMRNPNPKRAKMSFLSYNCLEIVLVDPKCRNTVLSNTKCFAAARFKKWHGPFKATTTATGLEDIWHSHPLSLSRSKKSTRNQETTQKDLKFCTKHLHRPPPMTGPFHGLPNSTTCMKNGASSSLWHSFWQYPFGAAQECQQQTPSDQPMVARIFILTNVHWFSLQPIQFVLRLCVFVEVLLMRHLEVAGMAQIHNGSNPD